MAKTLEEKRAYWRAYDAKRREEKREYLRLYRATHLPEQKLRDASYYQAHKEERDTQSRAWKTEHPEEMKIRRAIYRAVHCEEIQTKRAMYYIENFPEIKARAAAYYLEHRTQITEKTLEWRRANPEKTSAIARRHNAKKANAPLNNFTAVQWTAMKIHYGYRCVYCGRKMQRLEQDHIQPISKGGSHTLANIVPACRSCNAKKNAGPPLSPVQPMLL